MKLRQLHRDKDHGLLPDLDRWPKLPRRTQLPLALSIDPADWLGPLPFGLALLDPGRVGVSSDGACREAVRFVAADRLAIAEECKWCSDYMRSGCPLLPREPACSKRSQCDHPLDC
jgi:hypothetical protein